MGLPEDHRPYTDKYFLRSKEILDRDSLNPWLLMQVFVRKGPGIIGGIDEAVAIIERYSQLKGGGGKLHVLPEKNRYGPNDTVMTIEGYLRDFIELETMYLGVIAAETTKANDNVDINLENITKRTRQIVDIIAPRPLIYFGARHWRYDLDAAISEAAFKGGAGACSTDIGAKAVGKEGVGTIPHALIIAYATKYGKERATVEAAKAFDKYIDRAVQRTVLVDTFNKEITDSIDTAKALEGRLNAVRLDTCGENIGENGTVGRGPYKGHGVTIELAYNTRRALDKVGFSNVGIVLSSGYGDVEKVRAFVEAEKELGIRLFDGLGIGGLYKARYSTADIVLPFGKTGRVYRPNPNLVKVW